MTDDLIAELKALRERYGTSLAWSTENTTPPPLQQQQRLRFLLLLLVPELLDRSASLNASKRDT